MEVLKKIYISLIITVIGLFLLIWGFINNQLPLFNLAAAIISVVGIIATLSSIDVFSKKNRSAILFGLIGISLVLTYLNYKAIKNPLDFQEEKNRRYQYVIQNLKDLRQAELAYKSQYGKYIGDIDSLIEFIKTDSLLVIKQNGTVPDGMTLIQAVDSGHVFIDTTKVPAAINIFDEKYLLERKVPFSLDSLNYVPFTYSKFLVEATIIERGKVKVPVFLITDTQPFSELEVLMVGSLVDPTTSGNWGE